MRDSRRRTAMATLFISDLHLDESRPQTTDLFFEFLASRAREAEALYILGDLFEVWIGDDDDSEFARSAQAAMADLRGANVPLYVMRGNRDFLMGSAFAERTGATVLDDYHCVDLYGVETLLMHGDLLCTDDVKYQRIRRQLRSPFWHAIWSWKSLPKRRALAAALRAKSNEAKHGKSKAIMDVNAQAVRDTFREHGVTRLIHGHTHRRGTHALDIDGAPAERIVLGEWGESGSVLVCDPTGCRFQTLG